MTDKQVRQEEDLATVGESGLATIPACRGVRGAVTVGPDPTDAALEDAVGGMLGLMLDRNRVALGDIAALVFTVQPDLGAANPAAAARARGFDRVPLLMVREHGGDVRLSHCIRALMLVNTVLSQRQIQHVYLGDAKALRPDLVADLGDRS
ncbi:MAG: chorismate mutase [Candidatus Dormibacteria bacterium]